MANHFHSIAFTNSYSFPNHFLFNSRSFLFISVPSMFKIVKVIENVAVNKICGLAYVLIYSESDWEGKRHEMK